MNKKQRQQRKFRLNVEIAIIGFILVIVFNVVISSSENKEKSIVTNKKISEIETIEKQNNTMSVEQISSTYIMKIDGISQEGIPTGCEAVSAVTALNYLGVNISPEEFIVTFLKKESFYYADGVLYGANPEEKFAGDPHDGSSLGCFPPVIEDGIEKMKEYGYEEAKDLEAKILKGNTIEDMCKKYVINDIPVLVWVTVDMRMPKEGVSYYFADGTRYTWTSGEHCMVLCGYDEENYYFKDPLNEGKTVKYEKELAELRYEQMGNRALAIMKK